MTRTNFIATNEQEHVEILNALNDTINNLNKYTLVGMEQVDFNKLSTYSMEREDSQTLKEFDSLAVEKALMAVDMLKDGIEELNGLLLKLYANRSELENVENYEFD